MKSQIIPKESAMSANQEKVPARLTRIALNELEVRTWRRHFSPTSDRVPGRRAQPESKTGALDRQLKSAARAAFQKMGED